MLRALLLFVLLAFMHLIHSKGNDCFAALNVIELNIKRQILPTSLLTYKSHDALNLGSKNTFFVSMQT